MTRRPSNDEGREAEPTMPRRDWILLPVLGIVTIFFLLACMELVARKKFSESTPFMATCLGPVDSNGGAWAHPSSVCWERKFETGNIKYEFNRCGHRAGMECGAKPPNTYRIVMGGSSFAMGHLVEREQTYAALLPVELSERTGRKVDLYNEGLITVSPRPFALRFQEVLKEKPDMVLWILGPHDVYAELPEPVRQATPRTSGVFGKISFLLKSEFKDRPFTTAVSDLFQRGVTVFEESDSARMFHSLLFRSRSEYLKSSLMKGDELGYLSATPDAAWQARLRNFDADVASVAAQTNAAGVPLVVALLPNRTEAAMISGGETPKGMDAFLLSGEVRAIVERHGGVYLDVYQDYRSVPNSDDGYFRVDGHPNPKGHAILADLLARDLTSGAVPELSTAAGTSAKGRP